MNPTVTLDIHTPIVSGGAVTWQVRMSDERTHDMIGGAVTLAPANEFAAKADALPEVATTLALAGDAFFSAQAGLYSRIDAESRACFDLVGPALARFAAGHTDTLFEIGEGA